ncbi:MAG: HAD-IA family hydrolase [Planctomycetota bacterium]
MDPIDIIFFDAGGTLLYPEPAVGEAYAQAGRRHGVKASAGDLERAFAIAFDEKKGVSPPQDREWWKDVVTATYAPFGEPDDPDVLFAELYDHFASPEAWRLYPGARETLDALRRERGYRTGLVSNWDDRLPGLLDGLSLTPGLDPVVVSYRVGVEKPEPLIFEVALAEAGAVASRALMVGDDPLADYVGAAAVGMHAVLLDRTGRIPDDGSAIRRLEDLLALLPPLPPGEE